VNDAQFTKGHAFPDEMYVQPDVLRASVMDGILAHVDGGDVVTVGYRGAGNVAVKLMEQLAKLDALSHGVHHYPVLGLRA